ncbi:ABC transporter substrate-binding protein [Aurantimonas aggregata]|uniref:ABC transporter substrate-binding protein n=1 Tax=Aurantimonas aggregata TaxID=2047720 RepID=A0A6L9MI01_9HYPH|nr:ABC transporter substrate-binding protein [Aurantimonas aggregata]
MPIRPVAGLRVLAALVMALAALPDAALAQARDTATIGMAIEPAGLDPTAAAPVAIGQVTWQNIYEGLTRIDRDGDVQPQLARAWTISEDGLTYVFTLEPDVSFSNGAAFTAETAKFALDRARGESSTNPQKQFFATIETVEATDPQTLTVTLSQPTGNLLYWLAWPAAVMVEPGSAATNNVRPVGTGPFALAEWRQGDRIELRRREDYWNADDVPALAGATFRFVADPQAQAAAIRSGDIDAFPEFGAPELYATLEGEADLATVVGSTELKVVAGMNGRKPPFDDPRVRRALMMAVDRETLIQGVYAGYGEPIGSHYAPNDPGYVDLTGTYAYDPVAARQLLAEAGYPDGFALTIKAPQMAYASRSAEVLQAFFADIGVTLQIVPTEFPARWVDEVFTRHDFDMTIVAHAEPLDIGIYARPDYYFGYANPAFDAAIVAAETATDPAERIARYGEAQRILADEVPALYLFVMPKLGVWNAALTGLWENEPIPSNDLTDVAWTD